ncbi:MAG: pilus assembly protein, partial [Anaerolineae bacterium]|nr:pilus assembly protein [Anaerolineae bacterium]
MSKAKIVEGARTEQPRDERGQGLVEFALVALFLFLVMFAIIDFARVFFGYATMSNGVREGARYAVVHPDDTAAIEDAARAMMLVIGAPVNVQVSFPKLDRDNNPYLDQAGEPCGETNRGSRCPVVVTAASDFPVWTP